MEISSNNFDVVHGPAVNGRPAFIAVRNYPVEGGYPILEIDHEGERYYFHARGIFLPKDASPDEVRSFYKYWAPDYDSQLGWIRQIGHNVADITNSTRGSVLDVTSGTGLVSEGLVEAGYNPVQITNLDNSPDMLEIAREKKNLEGVRFIEADVVDLSFPDNEFDLVVSALGLYHVNEDAWEELFAKMKQWLGPDGKMILVDTEFHERSRKLIAFIQSFFGTSVQKTVRQHKRDSTVFGLTYLTVR